MFCVFGGGVWVGGMCVYDTCNRYSGECIKDNIQRMKQKPTSFWGSFWVMEGQRVVFVLYGVTLFGCGYVTLCYKLNLGCSILSTDKKVN